MAAATRRKMQTPVESSFPVQAPLEAVALRDSVVVPLFPEAVRERAVDPDHALVVAAREGNARAFEMLIRKHQSAIINLARRLVGEADAEDVAQEAFVKVHRALKGFKGDSLFSTWIYRIAVNTGKNHLASRNRRPSFQDIDVADAELFGHSARMSNNDTPEHELLSDEIREKVLAVINGMSPDLRRAITLREFETMSYEEIAEDMDCPVGTVRSRIFRAREIIDVVLQPLVN